MPLNLTVQTSVQVEVTGGVDAHGDTPPRSTLRDIARVGAVRHNAVDGKHLAVFVTKWDLRAFQNLNPDVTLIALVASGEA